MKSKTSAADKKYQQASVIIIIIFAVMVFSLATVHHVSGDACWHVSAARHIGQTGDIPTFEQIGRSEPFWPPPLFHIVGGAFYSLSQSEQLIQYVSPLFGVAALIMAWLLISQLYGKKIGYYATLFLAFIPLFIDYSTLSYVESMLTFFILLSLYLAFNKRYYLSAIAIGLGILTKYNAGFAVPVLLWIVWNKEKRDRAIKIIAIMVLMVGLISLPWFIRNFLILGNPVWPFLNFLFDGHAQDAYQTFDISKYTNPLLISTMYLELFGVPNGSLHSFSFFDIPYLNVLLTLWLVGTVLFLVPVLFVKKIKKFVPFVILAVFFFLLLLLYVPNVSFAVTRIILPAIPVLAIVWAHGFDNLLNKKRDMWWRRSILVLFALIAVGFVFTSFVKINLSANAWNQFQDDYDWVRENTPHDAVVLVGGQCSTLNLNRFTLVASEETLQKADYAFVNQNFPLDVRVELDDTMLTKVLSSGEEVYKNQETGTSIIALP